MNRTVIYTKPGCPYCAAAMADFRARGEAFEQIDVKDDLAARAEFAKVSPHLRVPTIVRADGSIEIGFDGY